VCIECARQSISSFTPEGPTANDESSEFINEGAMDLITYGILLRFLSVLSTDRRATRRVRDNEEAYNRYKIRSRVMRDVSNIDISTTMWGKNVSEITVPSIMARR
jgi:hypothetical protein